MLQNRHVPFCRRTCFNVDLLIVKMLQISRFVITQNYVSISLLCILLIILINHCTILFADFVVHNKVFPFKICPFYYHIIKNGLVTVVKITNQCNHVQAF